MSNIRKNIAVFSSNWLGVSETFIYRQLAAISESGHNSIILTQKIKESALKLDYKGNVYYKPISKFDFYKGVLNRKINLTRNGYAGSGEQLKAWRKGVLENEVNLIHAHYGPSGLCILPLAKKLDIPLITTFHGNDASAMLRKRPYVKALKELFTNSYMVTVSNFLRERLIKLGASEDRIFCHYIGTDLNKFQYTEHKSIHQIAKENKKITFLQVSNFVEKKGHKYSIEAFNNFLKVYPNSEFLIAGDGGLRSEIENQVKDLGIENSVKFLGAITPKQVSEYMSQCNVFLHHSVTASNGSEEGIPTVIMEAMACGIPVVSSKHAGIPELISDDCGYIIGEGDVEKYSAVLKSLLTEDTLLKSTNAKQRVYEYFDIHKQNKKLIDLYTEIEARYNRG